MTIEYRHITPEMMVRIVEFEDALKDAEHQIREFWNMADPDTEAEKAAQSIMNKLGNVRKAFVHEFMPND